MEKEKEKAETMQKSAKANIEGQKNILDTKGSSGPTTEISLGALISRGVDQLSVADLNRYKRCLRF